MSVLKAKRTPRYLLLSSPPFFATICVHWGLTPLATTPRLTVTPATFLGLVVAGRMVLDLHLRTVLNRPDLRWARNEVLLSTNNLLSTCLLMYVLETIGEQIITYIKPIMVLVFFGLGSAGFQAIAVYSLVARV